MVLMFSCQDQPFGLRSDSQTSPVLQQIVIPEGATFESATLYVYADQAYGHTINVHRITAAWDEMTVSWSSFGGAYDAAIVNSFVTAGPDWYSVDVSDLVLGWMLEDYPNYGLLLDQGVEVYPMTRYRSKESETNKPYIEVCYTYEGDTECETDIVMQDAFIWELWPGSNYGDWVALFTGWESETTLEKQAMLQFEFEYTPPEDDEGCTLTIGYWKTHAGFGPQPDMVTQYLPIWLGTDGGAKSIAVTSAAIAVDVLNQNVYGTPRNGITKLYAQLLGAKLNLASGAGGSALGDIIEEADLFLADHDWNDWESLSEEDMTMVNDWKDMLDDYNNGYIGPGHCDDFEEVEMVD